MAVTRAVRQTIGVRRLGRDRRRAAGFFFFFFFGFITNR
jgi:hypothetical protein